MRISLLVWILISRKILAPLLPTSLQTLPKIYKSASLSPWPLRAFQLPVLSALLPELAQRSADKGVGWSTIFGGNWEII